MPPRSVHLRRCESKSCPYFIETFDYRSQGYSSIELISVKVALTSMKLLIIEVRATPALNLLVLSLHTGKASMEILALYVVNTQRPVLKTKGAAFGKVMMCISLLTLMSSE